MVLSWYKYRPVYTQGPRDWKYIKTAFSMRVVREVIMEDGDVNVFSEHFVRVDLRKVAKPPVEVIEQTINLIKDTINKSQKYLVSLEKDLKKQPPKKLKADKKLLKKLAAYDGISY